jgi:predicted HTH domain antitoxin
LRRGENYMALTLSLSDEVLKQAGMTAEEARVEIACRLFDAGKLTLWPAAQLAQLPRADFEEELHRRQIPVYRPTVEDFKADLETLDRLGI